MEVYVIAILVFVAFAWSRALLRFKERQMTAGGFSIWSLVWAAVVAVAVWPEHTIGLIAHRIGIQRPVDVAVYASIIVLFYLVFKIYIKIENVQRDITKMVREMAKKKK